MTTAAELQAQADEIEWYHSIDLGNGVVTKGIGVQETGTEIFPDVRGRSVLDIGAWDGKFSFLAEQAGAVRVSALDHYAWGVDFQARGSIGTNAFRRGPCPTTPATRLTSGSRTSRDAGGSTSPRPRWAPRWSRSSPTSRPIDLDSVGTFDVVLYLGVLYHMKEPLTCLERVRAVTKEVAVIETEAVHFQGLEHEAVLQFHAGMSLRVDFGNWYVFTIEALRNLCRAAGFSMVRTIAGPPEPGPGPGPEAKLPWKVRAGRRLAGWTPAPPSAPSANYRAIVHAYV